MATNFIQDGDVLTLAAPAALSSGDPVLVGSIFGIAITDAESGADVAIATTGVWSLPKVSAQAWTLGAPIYWAAGAGNATTVSTANTFIGYATAVAVNPSATGLVKLVHATG